ncbi:unnamed protein product [Staurois parvus]|uniref:Uncharacterized protein n=1 Tax=Staurois parvus TaxID=386267 RepID=A0ABN9CV90_9NEOB|nr:unnamed protein product [Staurois parvus]
MPLVPFFFHRLFGVWARTQGPHDPLLPGGPMSCQSAPSLGTAPSCSNMTAHQCTKQGP